jgi:tRNA pseudouridine55 synthase
MNGLLLIDKPQGITSHDVVATVRRITGERSIGHLGTLDPMATGLLPLLAGKWTRLAQFFGSLEKTYTGTIRFGFATDTYDAEGTAAGPVCRPELTLERLELMAAALLGTSEQMPPAYSAKKIGGKPAYAIARTGETPALKPATIRIDSFSIESLARNDDGTQDAAFRLQISAGGYVRSVAHSLGEQAGCGAHLAALRRVAAGPLRLESALTFAQLQAAVDASNLDAILPHPRTVLAHMPAVQADATTLVRMRNGAQVHLPEFSTSTHVRVFSSQHELAGIAKRIAGVLFQPIVVLA